MVVMAWPSWVLGVLRAFRGLGFLLYLPPPEGESETRRRAQRLKPQPVRAGRRPPPSGALEKGARRLRSTALPGPSVDRQALDKAVVTRRVQLAERTGRADPLRGWRRLVPARRAASAVPVADDRR